MPHSVILCQQKNLILAMWAGYDIFFYLLPDFLLAPVQAAEKGQRMARLENMPEPQRSHIANTKLPLFDNRPWVEGSSLNRRRIAIVSNAGLHRRNVSLPASNLLSPAASLPCEAHRAKQGDQPPTTSQPSEPSIEQNCPKFSAKCRILTVFRKLQGGENKKHRYNQLESFS